MFVHLFWINAYVIFFITNSTNVFWKTVFFTNDPSKCWKSSFNLPISVSLSNFEFDFCHWQWKQKSNLFLLRLVGCLRLSSNSLHSWEITKYLSVMNWEFTQSIRRKHLNLLYFLRLDDTKFKNFPYILLAFI